MRPITTETKPMTSDTREPKMILDSMSRPRSSVPSRLCTVGPTFKAE